MASTVLTSGILTLASGQIFSGSPFPIGGILLYYDKLATSGIPIHVLAGQLSGTAVTFASGGGFSSGGMADGMAMYPGDSLFINKSKMINTNTAPVVSGMMLNIQIGCPAGMSGSRLWWEFDVSRF